MKKDSLTLRILYGTVPGRVVLKILVQPWVSALAGFFLDSKFSTRLIPSFVKQNKIDTWDVCVPEEGFQSFNAFFCRERNMEKPIKGEGELLSPCDAYLSCIPIQKDTILDIKHTKFTLSDLLDDAKLAAKFRNGYAFVFRLTPAHYHRYSYAADGLVVQRRKIKGKLHCVRPIATSQVPVYTQNSREYEVIESEQFGKIVQMEVGALLVGRIANEKNHSVGAKVKACVEKGHFEFGGSTIIVLVQENQVRVKEQILHAKNIDGEVEVTQYMPIAELISLK